MNWRALLWWRPPCILRRVILNTDDEHLAYEGVLWGARGAWLVLRQVQVLRTNEAPAPLDGEMVIHRERVAFLQVLD